MVGRPVGKGLTAIRGCRVGSRLRVDHRDYGDRGERRRGGKRSRRSSPRRSPALTIRSARTSRRPWGAGGEPLSVYGDSAYGSGSVLDMLERAGANILCKVKAPVAPAGRFTKDDFRIDMELGAVVCLPGGPRGYARSRADRSPGSNERARRARCSRSAPPHRPGRRSVSARTSSNSPADASAKQIRRGTPTTKPPARRSSGRSAS